MAKKFEYTLIDDVDGSRAAETVSFSLDGVSYDIDLSEENAKKLREEFGQWIKHSQKLSRRRPAIRRVAGVKAGIDAGAIRAWARSTGREVSDRGRIPMDIRQAYQEAMGQ